MKKITFNILLAATLLVSFSCSNNKSGQGEDSKEVAEDRNEEKFDDSNVEKDTEFAVAAADGGMMEVELGRLALTKGSSAQVKQFAQMMVDDHTKANEELKALAQQKSISLPSSLSDKKRKKYDDFNEKKAEDFDKDYIDFMVSDHKDDIDEFEKEADKGNDPDLKAWAGDKLPILRHHLEMAEQAKDAVKNNNNNNH